MYDLLKHLKEVILLRVFEFPPNESCNNRVNFEFRYGTWVALGSVKAEMTLPRVDNDKLILVASFKRCPEAPVFD
uniref:Uncharacterized protein n=1 Tax=Romanomermis culicivorax TaxID=13658 RepID=A0A915HNJ9_ROMCU